MNTLKSFFSGLTTKDGSSEFIKGAAVGYAIIAIFLAGAWTATANQPIQKIIVPMPPDAPESTAESTFEI